MTATLYAGTLARLQAVMERHGLAVVLLTQNHHTRYVTGYQRYFSASSLPFVHAVAVGRRGGACLLLPEHIRHFGERACHAAAVGPFPGAFEARVDALATVVRAFGAERRRIGLDVDLLRADYLEALRTALPSASFRPAADCLAEAMRIKLPEEVAWLRRSAQLVDLGTAACFEAVRAGRTEQQVAAAGAAALAAGAEAFHHCCVRTGENAIDLCPINTDRIIGRGDVVQLDLGFVCGGYVSDINRTLIVGGPMAKQAHIIRTVVAMERAVVDALRPGVRGRDLYALARGLAAAAGLEQHFVMPYVGHGIGLSLQERPLFTYDSNETVEAGMVLAIEPGLYVPGLGACRTEDMVLVTETGVERLTTYPDDLTLNGLP